MYPAAILLLGSRCGAPFISNSLFDTLEHVFLRLRTKYYLNQKIIQLFLLPIEPFHNQQSHASRYGRMTEPRDRFLHNQSLVHIQFV